MTDLFKTPEAPLDQAKADALNTLKQKFAKEDGSLDVEALLNAKAESDIFIDRLQGENAGVREEMNKRATFDQLLEKINQQQARKAEEANHAPDAPEGNEPSYKPEDIKKMVSESFNQEQTKAAQQKNVNEVKATLEKNWGPNFAAKLTQVTTEFELSQEEAGFMAATRPKAFLKLVLGDKAPVGNFAPPQSSQRMEQSNRPTGETYSSYKAMMTSTDPRVRAEYWSPRVQNKLHALAMEHGEAFLKS